MMIGDIILWIKQFIKQQTCIHDYKPNRIVNIMNRPFDECIKCDKLKP